MTAIRSYPRKPGKALATLKSLLHSEVCYFCAGLGSPGEPVSPAAIQAELLMRLDAVFDFYIHMPPETSTASVAVKR
ncbi:hypothetical protein ACVQY5_001875 [Escherichia coli]